MELQIGNMAEMVELGLTGDIVAGGRINTKPNPGSAAGDYITRYTANPEGACQQLQAVLGGIGAVSTITLDKLCTPSGEPARLHVIGTHFENDWSTANDAVMLGFDRIHDIITLRPVSINSVPATILQTLGKSIDWDKYVSPEDLELLGMFGRAASARIIASFLIGGGSHKKNRSVDLRAILAQIAGSKLGAQTSVILRPEESDLVPAGLPRQRTPLISAEAKKRVQGIIKFKYQFTQS
ncbi:MAG: hypothetical protein WC753_03440 [Candidatus Gracilibacteria bacterium]